MCNCQTLSECNEREGCVCLLPDPGFVHFSPRTDMCDHDFQGWRDFEDGRGGERVCTKCGLGAMAHTLSLDI